MLAAHKAEDTQVADGAAHFPLVLGAVRLAAVLDDREVVLAGKAHDGPHVARAARDVAGDDGLCVLVDPLFD